MSENFTPIPNKWITGPDTDPLAILVAGYLDQHTYTGTAICRTHIRWIVEWLGYKPNSNPGKINQRVVGLLEFLCAEGVCVADRPLLGLRKSDDIVLTMPQGSLLNGNPTAMGAFAMLPHYVQDAIVTADTLCDRGGLALVAAYLAGKMSKLHAKSIWLAQAGMAQELMLDLGTLRSWLAALERFEVLWRREVVTMGADGTPYRHNIYAFDPNELEGAEVRFRKWKEA